MNLTGAFGASVYIVDGARDEASAAAFLTVIVLLGYMIDSFLVKTRSLMKRNLAILGVLVPLLVASALYVAGIGRSQNAQDLEYLGFRSGPTIFTDGTTAVQFDVHYRQDGQRIGSPSTPVGSSPWPGPIEDVTITSSTRGFSYIAALDPWGFSGDPVFQPTSDQTVTGIALASIPEVSEGPDKKCRSVFGGDGVENPPLVPVLIGFASGTSATISVRESQYGETIGPVAYVSLPSVDVAHRFADGPKCSVPVRPSPFAGKKWEVTDATVTVSSDFGFSAFNDYLDVHPKPDRDSRNGDTRSMSWEWFYAHDREVRDANRLVNDGTIHLRYTTPFTKSRANGSLFLAGAFLGVAGSAFVAVLTPTSELLTVNRGPGATVEPAKGHASRRQRRLVLRRRRRYIARRIQSVEKRPRRPTRRYQRRSRDQ